MDDHLGHALRWWRELRPDRAASARLRRCERIEDAAMEGAAIRLARAVGVTHGGHRMLGDAMLAAIVLAHVREDRPGQLLGRALRDVMSPLRLSRLLSADTHGERLVAFRRAVALLGGQAPVHDVAGLLLRWDERARIRLVFDYHAVPPPGADAPAPQPAARAPP